MIEIVPKMKYDSINKNMFKYDRDQIAYNEYYITSALANEEFYFINICPIWILIFKKKHIQKKIQNVSTLLCLEETE